jgi:hypothetical protein
MFASDNHKTPAGDHMVLACWAQMRKKHSQVEWEFRQYDVGWMIRNPQIGLMFASRTYENDGDYIVGCDPNMSWEIMDWKSSQVSKINQWVWDINHVPGEPENIFTIENRNMGHMFAATTDVMSKYEHNVECRKGANYGDKFHWRIAEIPDGPK